jgi:DNA helicase-2/ATP-dependent DNA helicase PcrA
VSEEYKRLNYDLAKVEADKVDAQIIETLKSEHSFRVEAGAGSGKTYSLNRAIEWIQANKWSDYSRKKQNVVCITYTNAAVAVIAERLAKDSFILPSTIHSFAWNAIKQYQRFLIDIVTSDPDFLSDEGDFFKVTEVTYTLGHRYKENGIQYLYHDDVLKLFCLLLDNAKFRRVFADKYPLILIDEYQDSYKPIIDRFVDYFIAKGIGPQFGFFGDAWQTIYQSNKACGAIEHDNIDVIKKSSNFRSAPRIVQLLNDIRPDLPQKSAIDGFDGKVVVITCEDYNGARRTDRNFKGELPPEVLKSRLDEIEVKIKQSTPNDETLKILMITHKVLATQQGYEQLLDVLGDGLRDKEDPFLLFFMNTVEPIYKALCTSNTQLLFDTLAIKRYPITKKSEKVKWQELREHLAEARTQKAIDVLELVYRTDLIPIPPKLNGYYRLYHNAPETMYIAESTIRSFLDLEYTQFLAAIDFLYPEAVFSTEHGVKGEEYDNVVFVVSKGWNQYQFETYAPMITGHSSIPKGNEASFERNRNLFYVCCSRPRKRLFFFVSVPIDAAFRSFLTGLVGTDNIYTYSQYLETDLQ